MVAGNARPGRQVFDLHLAPESAVDHLRELATVLELLPATFLTNHLSGEVEAV